MTIRFRRKRQAEWMIVHILAMSFAMFILTDFLRLPSIVKYTADVAWCWLLLLMLINRMQLPNRELRMLIFIAGSFFLFSLFGFLINYQSPLYYFWGLRNNIRFFVFFAACALMLQNTWIENYFRVFDVLFWINFPVVLIQYFVMAKSRDYLGGIFGVEKGCNAYMNVFLLIVISRSVLWYLHNWESIRSCLAKCAVALLIAVFSELKVFLVEFVVLIFMALLMTQFSVRKLMLILGTGVGIVLALEMISLMFPDFGDWFSVRGVIEIIGSDEGYTGTNDINRLTAIPIVLERYLTDGVKKIFGLGLGNCDYASFDFLTTPFYQAHRSMHYYWFSSAFLILETGILGLTLYILFFVAVYFAANSREKKQQTYVPYCQLAKIMAVMTVIMIFYNAAMRTEAGFMVYFVLAIPFAQGEKQQLQVRLTNTQPSHT